MNVCNECVVHVSDFYKVNGIRLKNTWKCWFLDCNSRLMTINSNWTKTCF